MLNPVLALASNYPRWVQELMHYDGSPNVYQYLAAGALLVLVSLITAKREGSVAIIAVTAVAGVLCLTTGAVMSFLSPEATRTAQVISDKEHHKKDVGDPCRKTSDCMHGFVCANYRGENRCWRPCFDGNKCSQLLICVQAKGGQHVCVM